MATPVTTSYVSPSATTSATPTSTAVVGSSHSSNNPLLFFVALGFGVLFTNLWIIIGVKYCFRYQNARRRGALGGGDALAMGNVHHGRRRREKKLMTMEEVEAKFPQMTYKAWRVQRERQGLSTSGGVEAIGQEEAQNAREALNARSPSRAASIRSRAASMHSIEQITTGNSGVYEISKGGIIVSETPRHREEIGQHIDTTPKVSIGDKFSSTAIEDEIAPPLQGNRQSTCSHQVSDDIKGQSGNHEPADLSGEERIADEETSEQVEADEMEIQHLPNDIGAGDTCAICIEQLEDEDEVRGLSCGHAFHCSCVDVWLTTRRAICPLCKRDYWIRKTTPQTNLDRPGLLGDNELQGPQATMPAMPGVLTRRFWTTGLFARADSQAASRTEVDLEDGRRPTTEGRESS